MSEKIGEKGSKRKQKNASGTVTKFLILEFLGISHRTRQEKKKNKIPALVPEIFCLKNV